MLAKVEPWMRDAAKAISDLFGVSSWSDSLEQIIADSYAAHAEREDGPTRIKVCCKFCGGIAEGPIKQMDKIGISYISKPTRPLAAGGDK